MYTFQEQDKIGQQFQDAFTSLLDRSNIPWQNNPYSHTKDPRRADYDVLVGDKIAVEVKANPKAIETGNVCIEIDILEVSKSDYFVIWFPIPKYQAWDARVLTRDDIERILTKGYREVPAGQYGNISALVPVVDLWGYGMAVTQFIN